VGRYTESSGSLNRRGNAGTSPDITTTQDHLYRRLRPVDVETTLEITRQLFESVKRAVIKKDVNDQKRLRGIFVEKSKQDNVDKFKAFR